LSNGAEGNDATPSPAEGESRALAVSNHEGTSSAPHELQILFDLEKRRIESYNRRTDVARYAIEMNDAADKRQFEYRMAELQADESKSVRRHGLAKNIALGGGIAGAIVIALLLVMAFFGSEQQRSIALYIFAILGIGIGGYGAIGTAVRAVSKLFKSGNG
jgi:hypothetical protein